MGMTSTQLPLTHYIPPRDFQPLEQEFVVPVADDYFIWWLFKRKCVMCRRPATEINEIIPRGRSKYSIEDWRNRVTLCHLCHNEFHHNGVTKSKIETMQEKRKQFLISIDRELYVNYGT